jgi:hypothetical protein
MRLPLSSLPTNESPALSKSETISGFTWGKIIIHEKTVTTYMIQFGYQTIQ